MSETTDKMNIPSAYELFKLMPRSDEKDDRNFPKHVYDAAWLFVRTSKLEAAGKLLNCKESYLTLLQNGPDGKTAIQIGHPVLCWECGLLSLPKETYQPEGEGGARGALISPDSMGPEPPAADCYFVCRDCGEPMEADGGESLCHMNLVQGIQPDGSAIPFIMKTNPEQP